LLNVAKSYRVASLIYHKDQTSSNKKELGTKTVQRRKSVMLNEAKCLRLRSRPKFWLRCL